MIVLCILFITSNILWAILYFTLEKKIFDDINKLNNKWAEHSKTINQKWYDHCEKMNKEWFAYLDTLTDSFYQNTGRHIDDLYLKIEELNKQMKDKENEL